MSIASPDFSYIEINESYKSYKTSESGQWLLIINLDYPLNISWSDKMIYDFAEQTLNFAFVPNNCEVNIRVAGAQNEAKQARTKYILLILHPLWFDDLLDISEKRSKNHIENQGKVALWSFCAKHIPQAIFPTLTALQNLDALANEGFYQQRLAQALLMQILAQTVPLFKEGGCNHACHIRDRDYQKVRQAEQFIRANIHEPCILISLAQKVGMSDCNLKKAFKEVYGTSIANYLHTLRMQKAIALLHQDLNIGEIADEIGYKNHSNFTAAFKRTYGYSPKELRQNRHKIQSLPN